MECEIRFGRGWITTDEFESALTESGGFSIPHVDHLVITLDAESRFRIDSVVILLSLVQQSLALRQRVTFRISDSTGSGIQYLAGMGFFDALPLGIALPPGIRELNAKRNTGTGLKLVQVSEGDHDIPGQMRDLISRHARLPESLRESFLNTGWMLFSELLDNIREHSGVLLPSYAALQVYPQRRRVYVAISDSGLGLLATLRRGLPEYYPELVEVDDRALLAQMASEGISKLGKRSGRGLGIYRCLQKVHRLNGTLSVRFGETWGIFGPHAIHVMPKRESLQGTHFSVELPLDSRV